MFRVLFSIVVSLSVLDCKKDDKIDLSLTKKEADFVLDVLSSSIQNGTEEPGQDYKSDDSDESPNSKEMVEGTDALHTVSLLWTFCVHAVRVHSKSQIKNMRHINKRAFYVFCGPHPPWFGQCPKNKILLGSLYFSSSRQGK